MIQLDRILCAVDFSEFSRRALDLVWVALAVGGRSMGTVSVIGFVLIASRQDSSMPLSAAEGVRALSVGFAKD